MGAAGYFLRYLNGNCRTIGKGIIVKVKGNKVALEAKLYNKKDRITKKRQIRI